MKGLSLSEVSVKCRSYFLGRDPVSEEEGNKSLNHGDTLEPETSLSSPHPSYLLSHDTVTVWLRLP